MDLITYLRTLIESRRVVAKHDDDIKLVSKDNTNVVKKDAPTDVTYKPNDEGLSEFFPKEMKWLDWEDKSFRDALLDSQVHTESRGKANAISPAGAVGLAQFMPGTWADAKKKGWVDNDADRTDPEASIKAQKELMTSLYNRPEMKDSISGEERYAKTLAAYNAGYGSLRKALRKADNQGGYWLDYMSNETKGYIPAIMNKTEEEYFKNTENYISKYNRD